MTVEEKIESKISEFFEWINHPIVQNYYMRNVNNWDALCASLHIIRDIQRPKNEYKELNTINYLETIGIMQAIYIEQDSVQTLKNAILDNKSKDFTLSNYHRIRNKRNEIFGHPSDKKSNGIITRHFFDIDDEKKQIIKHLFWGTTKQIDWEYFNLKNLIEENLEITFKYLQTIEIEFKNKFIETMKNYEIKFDNIFQDAFYAFPKILSIEHDSFIIDYYYDNMMENLIKNLTKGLQERNLYKEYEKAIKVLEFLNSKLTPLFYKQTYKDVEFYTYASTLNNNIRELAENLRQIDKVFDK